MKKIIAHFKNDESKELENITQIEYVLPKGKTIVIEFDVHKNFENYITLRCNTDKTLNETSFFK